MEKEKIRKQMKTLRRNHTDTDLFEKSLKICGRVLDLPVFQNADVLFVYSDCNGEVSTKPLIEAAWRLGKRVAIPRVNNLNETSNPVMDFYYINSFDEVHSGYQGIPEPDETTEKAEEEDSLVILPGIGFDRNRNRCGYGKGFYDYFLSKHSAHPTVALAFDFQIVDDVPSDSTDIKPQILVTETSCYYEENLIIEAVPDTEPARQNYFIEKCHLIIEEKEHKSGKKLLGNVTTFGCQMNAKDSEKLRGILLSIGYELTDKEEADLVLYNTCTVRENANMKVYGHLGYLSNLKKKNPQMIIGLCGCMMQEPDVVENLKKNYRFINLIFGTHNIYKFAELLYQALQEQESKQMVIEIINDNDQIVESLPQDRTYTFKSGVNIMYGCNNFCTYCIVPYVRGREKSRTPEEILCEVNQLSKEGVKEVMLLGQNVNSYGKTLDNPISFAKLLTMVEEIPGIERIRFMTSHPKDLSDELIEVMKNSKKICRHLHLPLQSGSTRILKKMNRNYTKEQYLSLAEKLRREIPDLSITTDIIVGFPGETEEDFEETLDVVQKVHFDNAFTFLYSKRTGTPAAKMEDQVPKDVAKERFDRLLKLVKNISQEMSARIEGEVQPVLVESVNEHDPSLLTGRLSNNLLVHFPGTEDLIGSIADVHLTECKGFYYLGEL